MAVIGELTALIALTEPKGEWAEEVVKAAIATQLALILVMALRAIFQIGRPPAQPQAPAGEPARDPSLVWAVVLWLLLRRSRWVLLPCLYGRASTAGPPLAGLLSADLSTARLVRAPERLRALAVLPCAWEAGAE